MSRRYCALCLALALHCKMQMHLLLTDGLTIGSETSGGIINVTFEDIHTIVTVFDVWWQVQIQPTLNLHDP